MKLMIASDLHGSAFYCEKLLASYRREKAERLLLLGDLLYHGPRNDLPKGYAPKEVISQLNGVREELLCVRGNCDAEVDQMVLQFPILSDSMLLYLDGRTIFATHGHLYHQDKFPPLKPGDILLHGHTHVPALREIGSNMYWNPGSVALPKEGSPNSYMLYEEGMLTLKDLYGKEIQSRNLTNKETL